MRISRSRPIRALEGRRLLRWDARPPIPIGKWFVSTLRAQKVTELRDFVLLSLGVRDAVQSGAGCVNDACVGNYAPVYVLVEG